MATTQGNLPITHSSPEDTANDVEELFADLADENNLIGLDHHTFVTRLADYWARMTEIYPFADGAAQESHAYRRGRGGAEPALNGEGHARTTAGPPHPTTTERPTSGHTRTPSTRTRPTPRAAAVGPTRREGVGQPCYYWRRAALHG
ncbi:hypothetical protein [Rhodococcus baikonurensis]